MASVHPIMDALREKRIKRGMTLSKLARVANLSRESIRKRETRKFPQLMVLDRWCRALGYKLTLTEIDPPLPNQQGRVGERLRQALAHATVPVARASTACINFSRAMPATASRPNYAAPNVRGRTSGTGGKGCPAKRAATEGTCPRARRVLSSMHRRQLGPAHLDRTEQFIFDLSLDCLQPFLGTHSAALGGA